MDLTNQIQFATTPTKEAADNIEGSKLFSIAPDAYAENKSNFQTEADILKIPTQSTKVVHDYGKQSSQHISLIKNDIPALSQAETILKDAGDKIKGDDIEQRYANLKYKKEFNPSQFTDQDDFEMMNIEETIKDRRQFRPQVTKPGKHDEIINKFVESRKESSFLTDSMNALGAGLSDFTANVGKVPALLYDAYFLPANLIRAYRGEPQITAPESLKNNPVVERYSQNAKTFRDLVPELNKSITESVSSGDFSEAGKIAALQFLQNAPNQAALIGAGLTGFGALGLGIAGATTAAQANYENQQQGFTPVQSIPNALAKGTIEAAFENIGTLGMLKHWESALTKSFGQDTARKVLFNTVKAITAQSAGEGIEEAATSAAQDLTDYVSGINPDALKGIGTRALDAGILGSVSGVAMSGPATIAKAKSNIKSINENKAAAQRAIDILNFDTKMTETIETLKNTEMAKASPMELNELAKKMLQEAGIKSVYVDKEDLNSWANSPEKAAKVRDLISPEGQAAAAINAPIKFEAHQFMELRGEFPDIGDIGKLNPEDPSVKQALEYLQSNQEAQTKRAQVLNKLGVGGEVTAEDTKMIQETLNPEQPSRIYPSNDVFGENEYLDSTKLEQAIAPFMGKEQAKKYVEAQTAAKQQVVDNINETAEYELNQVVDVQMEEILEMEKQAQLERLENNPRLELVDKFTKTNEIIPNERYITAEEAQAAHRVYLAL